MKFRYIISRTIVRRKGEYEYSSIADYCWDFNTYFISDFLSIEIRKLKIETIGFNMLYLILCKDPLEYIRFNDITASIRIFVPFSQSKMESLMRVTNFIERIETYLWVYEQGYKIANHYYDIQVDKLLLLHQKFRERGYKHEWLFKKKIIREYGIYIFFKCYLTSIDFRLELEVYNTKQTILITKGVVFQTAPDRICFGKEFNKGIKLEGNIMYLLDFLEKPNFEFNLEQLSRGKFNVKYKQNLFDWRDTLDKINWMK